MKSPILYFFLLVLKILLHLGLDIGHKRNGFSLTLLQKGLEFILSKGGSLVAYNLGFLLLPAKVDLF